MTEIEFLTVGIILVIFTVLSIYRIDLVYRRRLELIAWVFSVRRWPTREHYLTDVSYEKMIFQLNKWTFKQFYPEVNLDEEDPTDEQKNRASKEQE